MKANWGLEVKEGKSAFISWIDADYWLYGLIYQIVFKGKDINDDLEQLFRSIKRKIREKKDSRTGYPKTPNGLSNLRDRIQDSINLYSPYVH